MLWLEGYLSIGARWGRAVVRVGAVLGFLFLLVGFGLLVYGLVESVEYGYSLCDSWVRCLFGFLVVLLLVGAVCFLGLVVAFAVVALFVGE